MLRKVLREFLIRLHQTNKYPYLLNELKFSLPEAKLLQIGYRSEDLQIYNSNLKNIRTDVCNIISKYSDGVFATIVDKQTITKPTWTPETLGNFVFAQTLHTNILNTTNLPFELSILYDSGRLAKSKVGNFHNYIFDKDRYYKNKGLRTNNRSYSLQLNDTSSTAGPCIWAADFVAGAFYRNFAHGDPLCAEDVIMRCKRIGNGMCIFWKE